MEIIKSSRHHNIIGKFGEYLVCNWLSRSGFEVIIVDHTGIDIIAYNPNTGKRLGISVKSRTRKSENNTSPVNLFSYQGDKNDRKKFLDACQAFACEPWIAIYVERPESADLFLLSLQHYDNKYRGPKQRKIDDWKMSPKYIKLYKSDPEIRHIEIKFSTTMWDW